jgi:hypothetical protein
MATGEVPPCAPPVTSRHVCGGGSTNELLTESRIVSGGTVIVSPK